MKREIIIAALATTFAYLSGKALRPDHDPSPADSRSRAAGKSRDRATTAKGRAGFSSPHHWATLRRQAAMKPEALIEDLLSSETAGLESDWRTEHLLATHPEQLFAAFAKTGQDLSSLTRCWSRADPLRAIPLVLDRSGPFAFPLDPDGLNPPLTFEALGWSDPSLGLQMISDLPEDRRHPAFLATLMQGIATTSPSSAAGYFQSIQKMGLAPTEKSGELLAALAAADPQAAMDWARSQPRFLKGGGFGGMMMELGKSDLEGAMKLYAENSHSAGQSMAASSISGQLARLNEDLDTSWSWIEANVPADDLEHQKGNALSVWAWTHRDKLAARILEDPDLLLSPRAGELLQAMEHKDQLVAKIDTLPPEAAKVLREHLVRSGAVPSPALAPDQLLQAMAQSPESPRAGWEDIPEKDRKDLAGKLAHEHNPGRDPRLVLELVSASPELMESSGAQTALGRLASMDPSSAAKFAEAIEDATVRKAAMAMVHSQWMLDDEAAADAWLAGDKGSE